MRIVDRMSRKKMVVRARATMRIVILMIIVLSKVVQEILMMKMKILKMSNPPVLVKVMIQKMVRKMMAQI